ncbi:efflux transporter outer membrane subunit [Pseudomonas monteilii]|uniref:efflux transporter outer membrane subunit n=1 Tax=Pseudomonas TaxID=286 RepID=UPI0015E45D11|nr:MULTISPECIES: efflux transporter outer membrane subunit [Pseudomonas]ELS0924920.1 efflux transporter outer membrane subunit [Pseudomonas putida]MBA1316156.1 efflux transporter outer membrane subunit [Pseudomonas monteilii]QUN67057.1 efflux transporter outer membrane subunit [Pseudomonas sp. JS425]
MGISGLLATALSGCLSLSPELQTPPAPVPQSWQASRLDGADVAREEHNQPWRSYFTDPVLQRLIETALDNNRDLRSAILRVEESRTAFAIQRSERFPEITIDAQGARSRLPGDLNLTERTRVAGDYRAQVGLNSWELDLWGRVRSLEDAALQSWLATEAAQQAVRIALITEVADIYLGLRELDERISKAHQSVISREESYRIFSRRYQVGATAKLELTQVQTLLTQAQSLLAQLEQARDNQINALRLLVGGDPGALPQQGVFDETTVLAELAPGLSSDLLENRPDIIAAEHRLRAANANIGAARAAFFPRIALTGGWGTASADLDGLFDSGSRAWSFVPTLSLPIFDGGRRRANLELSEVRRDLAIASYEQSIQTAFREVADALSARHWQTRQLAIQRTAQEAQAERARLAQLRYDNGSAAYLEVLDAQRDLLDSEQQLVSSRRALLSSQIELYSALGGDTRAGDASAAQSPRRPSAPAPIEQD